MWLRKRSIKEFLNKYFKVAFSYLRIYPKNCFIHIDHFFCKNISKPV